MKHLAQAIEHTRDSRNLIYFLGRPDISDEDRGRALRALSKMTRPGMRKPTQPELMRTVEQSGSSAPKGAGQNF